MKSLQELEQIINDNEADENLNYLNSETLENKSKEEEVTIDKLKNLQELEDRVEEEPQNESSKEEANSEPTQQIFTKQFSKIPQSRLPRLFPTIPKSSVINSTINETEIDQKDQQNPDSVIEHPNSKVTDQTTLTILDNVLIEEDKNQKPGKGKIFRGVKPPSRAKSDLKLSRGPAKEAFGIAGTKVAKSNLRRALSSESISLDDIEKRLPMPQIINEAPEVEPPSENL